MQASWQDTERYLNYFRDSLQEENVRQFFVANLALTKLSPELGDHIDFVKAFDKQVQQWCEAEKVPFFSLLPAIENVLQTQTLYDLVIVNDLHPTQASHQLIAQTLYPWLSEQLH